MLYNPNWNNDNWRKVLNKAADLIDQHGLAKGVQEDVHGRLCIHGALNIALDQPLYSSNAETLSGQAIRNYLVAAGKLNPALKGCGPWNNADDRTKQEVVDALRAAAMMSTIKE